MDERIKKQLAFSLEIDKVKNILRQTHLSGHGRKNSTLFAMRLIYKGLRGRISGESQTCTGSYKGLSDQGDQRLNYI